MSIQTIQTRLSSPQGLMLWLAGITVLAILGRITEGSSTAILPDFAILLTAAVSLLFPWHGLLALFPLGFALEPAPQGIGLRELGFAALCAAVTLGALKQALSEGTLGWNARRFAPIAVLLVAFLTLNFFVAMGNEIPMGYWLRGLIPFLFVLLFWPIGILLSTAPERMFWFAVSLFVLAFLFSAQVLYVYWAEGLYQPVYYLPVDGDFIRTEAPVDPTQPGDKIGPFFYRVTTFIAQSTDALLPVAFSVGYVISILASDRKIRWTGLFLTCLASTAILTTQTRSMLLCALLGVSLFGLALLFFQRRYFIRALVTGIGIIIFSVIMIFAINLDPVWHNRFLQLYYSLGINTYVEPLIDAFNMAISWVQGLFSTGQGGPGGEIPAPGIDPTVFSNDANILTRMEEYRIAYGIFQEQPLTGAGLGVRYDILADGEVFKQVGYVHNWIFYCLMTGGIGGVLIYGGILMLPALTHLVSVLRTRKTLEPQEMDRRILIFHMVWVALATLTLYGLFFAVFRLISFNLLLAAALGVTFHISMLAHKGER